MAERKKEISDNKNPEQLQGRDQLVVRYIVRYIVRFIVRYIVRYIVR